jgi:DNA repair ATPase RecN
MAESTTTPIAEEGTDSTTPQTAPMEQSGNGGNEPKTFTQEQVNRMIQERVARVKHEEPADYAELKAKAARLDEIEEANKSDLQKATDAAAKAKAAADEWKAKFEALEAEQARMTSVQAMAAQYKVDAGTLSRMSGDVEDNAKYLADLESKRPKYGSMSDGGDKQPPAQTLAEALKGVKSTAERIRIREEFNAKNHNR